MGDNSEFDAMNRALQIELGLPGASQDVLDDPAMEQQGVAESSKLTLEQIVAESGQEDGAAVLSVYLGTSSHLLPETLAESGLLDISTVSREQLCGMVRDAFDNPLAKASGPNN